MSYNLTCPQAEAGPAWYDDMVNVSRILWCLDLCLCWIIRCYFQNEDYPEWMLVDEDYDISELVSVHINVWQ